MHLSEAKNPNKTRRIWNLEFSLTRWPQLVITPIRTSSIQMSNTHTTTESIEISSSLTIYPKRHKQKTVTMSFKYVTMLPLAIRRGWSERWRKSCFMDRKFGSGCGEEDWAMMSLMSEGRNLCHAESESADSLKIEETRDDRAASFGEVKEMTLEMQSAGKSIFFFFFFFAWISSSHTLWYEQTMYDDFWLIIPANAYYY